MKTYYFYAFPSIYNGWEGLPRASLKNNFLLHQILKKAKQIGWDGHYSYKPHIFYIPHPKLGEIECAYLWKQSNNRITFIVSRINLESIFIHNDSDVESRTFDMSSDFDFIEQIESEIEKFKKDPSTLSAFLLNALREMNPIKDWAKKYTKLFYKDGFLCGQCPLNKEEKESEFTISSDTEAFYCFGCHAGGDVISLIGSMEKLSPVEVVQKLLEE